MISDIYRRTVVTATLKHHLNGPKWITLFCLRLRPFINWKFSKGDEKAIQVESARERLGNNELKNFTELIPFPFWTLNSKYYFAYLTKPL